MPLLSHPPLPAADPETRERAVRTVVARRALEAAAPSIGPASLAGRLPELAGAGREARGDTEHDGLDDAEAHFRDLLEAGFLVAAADGTDEAELAALADLIAAAAGSRASRAAVRALLDELREGLERDGLERRLDSLAPRFGDFIAREEALGFASLVALADGNLGDPEALALLALARRLDYSRGEVEAVLSETAQALSRALTE
ncbi:MAG: hypothetical protein IT376_09130 [Polyangiaceae bacterium]|nr:hypothetical protein [Polyangiaceae bacterium]